MLNTVEEVYRNFRASNEIPIKGFIRVLKIVLYFFTAIFVISIRLNKTPIYLHSHPMINTEMTFLVRQLQTTQYGLPIEIYVFSKDKVWANYEAIQADIFDPILAVLPEFDLRVFHGHRSGRASRVGYWSGLVRSGPAPAGRIGLKL